MIRLGLIGCGGISKSHASRFDRNTDLMQVTATADIVAERAQEAAQVVGAPKAATDFREILDDVDAVLLALPHHVHHEVGMACLEAGKHVLMEKPLANTERHCIDLIEAAQARGLVLMVAYCMRYHPMVVKIEELIRAKAYGDAFHVSIWTEQFTKYPTPDHWAHSAKTLGGGQLFSHGCHYIDILLNYLGRPRYGTHVGTNFGTPWMEREGTSDVSMKFVSGAVGYHGGTWGAKGTRLGYAFHVHCTEGMIEGHFRSGKLYLHQNGQEEKVLAEGDPSSKHVENEMAHFLDCIANGKKPLTDGPSSLQGLRVIWRMYEAEDKGVVADLRGLGLDEPWRAASAALPG